MQAAGKVTIAKPQKVQPGYVLYSAYAGEAFVLVDRQGRIVHEWPVGGPVKIGEMLPNGNLLYARMRDGVFEADWDNNLLWAYHCRQHHDFCRAPNGNTIALHNELAFNPKAWHGTIDKNDAFVEVAAHGSVVWRWHLDEHIDELIELAGLTFPRKQEDWAHTNTVEVLPDNALGRRDERFRAGNVVFSSRNLHTIGVIHRPSDRIVWAWGPGIIEGQHMPTMLPNGRMLLFDNGTTRGFSRVIELDPGAESITWEFRVPDYAFARAMSGQELLPNGNVLICAANAGVILEVTRDGEIVWELHNQAITGRREEYATAVYRAAFCPVEWVEPRL